ncbi:probable serine/threonine-protein kinase PBL7 [Andrographis paniculata]|uniref:probable serine/threonine-protein kinase PBL7 n=1 Tax=Andrographis paniculata TaxID=175694 RepID=UPI0021E96EF2|nr:probable serine/threonine-protein kinase PBL7 [Andrographis paniculata]
MSTNSHRVLIVQDASRKLCFSSMRGFLSEFVLIQGDVIRVLGIIQAFTRNGCSSWIEDKTKLHSSATINKHKEDIEEEVHKTRQRYLTCQGYKEMIKIASSLKIEFDVAVEAGLLKEVAVTYAKNFQATDVILYRQSKNDVKYFTQNLSCGIYRVKSNSIKIISRPQADEVGTDPPLESSTNSELSGQRRSTLADPGCSICKNKRPRIGNRRKFSYAELQLATNGFCPQNLVPDHGRKIYLSLLNDQSKAVVRESPSTAIKEEQFKRELKILENVGHKNVALLIGSCSDGPHRFLLYEYVCNGSLNKLLSEKSRGLTWERRIIIAHGVANGLAYLHGERIYGSMKPSNILITHDYHPLISYYGLSMNQYEALGQSSDTTTVRTFEYLAPEYQETGIDLSKADVYSFGVVLLELMTGRKTLQDTNGQSFLRWARPLLKKKKYMELIDPEVQDGVDIFQLYWLVRIAYKCLSYEPRSRYPMSKVVEALSGVINRSGVKDFSPTGSEW